MDCQMGPPCPQEQLRYSPADMWLVCFCLSVFSHVLSVSSNAFLSLPILCIYPLYAPLKVIFSGYCKIQI